MTIFISTSVGLINKTHYDYLTYILLYARANGEPNGAHIFSYLGVGVIGIITAIEFRDIFFGVLMSGFLAATHEGFWIIFYYLAYARFLDPSLSSNVLKDLAFSSMVVLVILAFWKYPHRPIEMKKFAWPIYLFNVFLAIWFIVPLLLNPYYYNYLPVALINNPKIGQGIYQMTQWYYDPLTNALEVNGWAFLFALFLMVVVKHRNKRN